MRLSQPEIIPLDPHCIDNPVRLDLVALEGHMLWPADKKMRDEAMRSSAVEFYKHYSSTLPATLLRDLVELAAGSIPIREIHNNVKAPFVHGIIAGRILRHLVSAVAADKQSDQASMKWIIGSLSTEYYPEFRLSPKTIENSLWPNYRPVAHFWAAYVDFAVSRRDPVFPCRLDRLPEFLGAAKAFGDAGETMQTYRSPGPILRASETVQLPKSVQVPKMNLAI